MVRAISYYRDQVAGSEYMVDQYDDLIRKLYQYGEEMTPEPYIVCETDVLDR